MDKNDYSPIEFEELSKNGLYCQNRDIAEYQIFNWNGIRLSPMVCYELTDVMARALLKGKCDFIAALFLIRIQHTFQILLTLLLVIYMPL